MPIQDPYKVPAKMQAKFDEIAALTDAFCQEHLNDEYASLSRRMTAALARKRPSPLSSGRANTWACAVVYAAGQTNFLFDQSQTLHMRADELCKAFGIAQSTGGNKAKSIRDALDITLFDHRWTLPSRMENSSALWMIMVNGFVRDARTLPLEVQEIAYEKGLIPYIPGSR